MPKNYRNLIITPKTKNIQHIQKEKKLFISHQPKQVRFYFGHYVRNCKTFSLLEIIIIRGISAD